MRGGTRLEDVGHVWFVVFGEGGYILIYIHIYILISLLVVLRLSGATPV